MAETIDGKLINRQDVIWFIIVVIALAFLIIVACFTRRTFSPQKSYFPESISVNVVDAGGRNKELSAEGRIYLKEQLHTALMEVSGKAESVYNEKFASLLTVLTIFGVAWPLILLLFQNTYFKQEIDKQTEQFHQQQQQQSEGFQRQQKQLSGDFQKQQEQLSERIQYQQKQMYKDFQKQKSINSEAIKYIEKLSEDLQQHSDSIRFLQRNSYMQFGVFGLKYIDDSNLILNIKCKERESKECNSQSKTPQYITRTFKAMIDIVNAFCKAELLVPSADTHIGDSLKGIRNASRKIYNLVWNYRKVIYNDVADELEECISWVEKIDQNLEEASQALQYLKDAKDLLEEDSVEQQAENAAKNESPSNGE